jgi:asparagine synthase (glutamine-hydrolysing)
MCGIFGHTIKSNIDLSESRAALNTLVHRGPDQWNDWYDNEVYSGHRRLSIIDLSENGKQPMLSNHAVLTVNGEIYNFKLLRRELDKDYRFVSNSDSEVLLHGYNKWGINGLLSRIEGMFAFSIYDIKKQKIYLARDRVGIKPLYYGNIEGRWSWSSELKAIEKFYGNTNLIDDNTAIYDFLTYLYIPAPKTRYQNIFKLQPAHYIEIDLKDGNSRIYRYWELKTDERIISLNDAAANLRHLVRRSIRDQMVSDVPVGFFLSGGLDSSTIVAESSKFSDKINTYSIGFDVFSHNETQFAELIARKYKTNHHTRILSLEDAEKLSDKMKDWYDEPFADTSALPTFLVSKFAREGSTVVLTGDGGDEIFGGYSWYRRYKDISNFTISVPLWMRKIIIENHRKNRYSLKGRILNRIEYISVDKFELYTKLLGGLLKEEKNHYRELFNIPEGYDDYWYFRKFYKPELSFYKRLQYLDFHTYLPDDILTKVDRVTMAVSLEARVPLLDSQLIEFMFSLPENVIYNRKELKGLLRFAYKDELPSVILTRTKRGFNIPLKDWDRKFLGDSCSQQEFVLSKFINLNS